MSDECDNSSENAFESKYIKRTLTPEEIENCIRLSEDTRLKFMKKLYEEYPSKRNDPEWDSFLDYVVKRRANKR